MTPNESNNPPGKLADAELHFTEGVLEGLKSSASACGSGVPAEAGT